MEKSYRVAPAIPEKYFHFNSFLRSSKRERIYGMPHWHEEIEILLFIKGDASQQVDDHIFNVTSGDIVFINSNSIHSTRTKFDHDNEILVVHFLPPLFNDHVRNLELRKQGLNVPNVIPPSEAVYNAVSDLIQEIQNEFENKNAGYEYIITGRLYGLIGLLFRFYGIKNNAAWKSIPSAKEQELLKKALDFIESNFDHKISFDEMLKIANVSPSHFCRIFKKATGMSFTDFVALHRVNCAQNLLISTHQSITEIAFESGFENHISLIRAFKKYKETTPSEFRKNYFRG